MFSNISVELKKLSSIQKYKKQQNYVPFTWIEDKIYIYKSKEIFIYVLETFRLTKASHQSRLLKS